jgi:PAS domain-containing protein
MARLAEWLNSSPDRAAEQSADGQRPALLPCDWLFSAAAEAVVVVDAATGEVVAVNPPAAAMFRTPCAGLLGMDLPSAFDVSSAATVEACLVFARVLGSAESLGVRARNGGAEMSVRLSLCRAPPRTYLLVRLTSKDPETTKRRAGGAESVVLQAIDRANVGFVMTDGGYRIEYANRAFIEMVGQDSRFDLRGSSLARWLTLTGSDLARLRRQLLQRQAVSQLTAQLCSGRNLARRVAVCAVAVPAGSDACWGFSICELPLLN